MQNKKSFFNDPIKLVLLILVVILFLGCATSGYFIFKYNKQDSAEQNIENTENVSVDENLPVEQEAKPTVEINDTKPNNEVGNLQVTYSDWPSVVSGYDVFSTEKIDQIITNVKNAGQAADYSYDQADFDYYKFMNYFDIYKVGEVNGGKYAGKDVLIMIRSYDEAIMGTTFYRVIKNGDELMLLTRQSQKPDDEPLMNKLFTKYTNLYLTGLDNLPATINIPNSTLTLKLVAGEPFVFAANYPNPKKLFKYDNENYLYKDTAQNCFFVRQPDGTARQYYLNLPFLPDPSYKINIGNRAPQLLKITFNDIGVNKSKYNNANQYYGCGGGNCYNYISYVTSINQLKEVAKSDSGEKFYELKDINVKERPEQDTNVLQAIYDVYYPGYDEAAKQERPKITFKQFLATHPLLFWQDPFGSFMEFRSADFLPNAECGKPVIYLYPTETTDVSVKVNPTGGFSFTEPAYNDGWQVKAESNGRLYNYADQKNYPYLFWEGFGLNYQVPDEGFVVPKNQVNNFLLDKLAKQGLNATESAEFIDFWLPKMQQDNYYFITFVPQTQFDYLAPLQVNPAPDTVIRVFMDYRGLSRPINVRPQSFVTPKRSGFTVVEWGGALHK